MSTCRLRHAFLAPQWHPRRELAARQGHTRSRSAALARVGSTHMGVNAALAERGTCARPTLIRGMQNTQESNAAAGRAAVFMRSPADSQKSVQPTKPVTFWRMANRRAVAFSHDGLPPALRGSQASCGLAATRAARPPPSRRGRRRSPLRRGRGRLPPPCKVARPS